MNLHKKEQHLSFEHRVLIQTHLKDGWSPNRIAKEIGCAPNTVRNEIKRETVILYKGNIFCYKATAGQATKTSGFLDAALNIEERPAEANDRSEFGHWEADLVIGSKKKADDALLTMIERKTCEYWMIRVPDDLFEDALVRLYSCVV